VSKKLNAEDYKRAKRKYHREYRSFRRCPQESAEAPSEIQKTLQALANAESDAEMAFYPRRGESSAQHLQRIVTAKRVRDEAKITYARLVEQ
jgi:hypothetical protein